LFKNTFVSTKFIPKLLSGIKMNTKMSAQTEIKTDVVILFAGDSGDGIQLTGSQFSTTAALYGNDISTFPNFPAEIRAHKAPCWCIRISIALWQR
jgi:hypothetical protein